MIGSTQTGGVGIAQRRVLLRFSPDGAALAYVRDKTVHVRDLDSGQEQALATGGPVVALSFAGPRHLAAVVEGPGGLGALYAWRLPEGKEILRRPLSELATRVIVGHPRRPVVLLAPRPASEAGVSGTRSPCFTALQLDTGETIGGGGPLEGSIEQVQLGWAGDAAGAPRLGTLRRWNLETRMELTAHTVEDPHNLAEVLWDGEMPGLVGWASPPTVTRPGADRTVLPGDLLLTVVGTFDRALALSLSQSGGHVTEAHATFLLMGAIEPGGVSLPWPVTGFDLHPLRSWLAWMGPSGVPTVVDMDPEADGPDAARV